MKEDLDDAPMYGNSYFTRTYHDTLDEIPYILKFDDNSNNDAFWTTNNLNSVIYKMPTEKISDNLVKATLHAYPLEIEDKKTWEQYFDGLWPKKNDDGSCPFIATYTYDPQPRNRLKDGSHIPGDTDAVNAISQQFRDAANGLIKILYEMKF